MGKRLRSVFVLLPLLLCFAGCAPKKPVPQPVVKGRQFRTLTEQDATMRARAMRAQHQDMYSWLAFRPAIKHSLAYVRSKPCNEAAIVLRAEKNLTVTWGRLAATLTRLDNLLGLLDTDPGLLGREFTWIEVLPDMYFTGYYLPAIHASLEPNEEYRYPLYGVPDDLQTLDLGAFHPRWKGTRLVYRMEDGKPVPYHDREAIDYQGALEGKAPEVAWARDPVEVQNLHTQGSGVLILPDGSQLNVGYAGKNGRQFRGLGGIFKRGKYLKEGGPTYANMSRYVAENPQREREIMAQNPSYVFFRAMDTGAEGTIGRPVTGRVSFAVDPKLIPLGAACAYDAPLPDTAPGAATAPTGLGLAQDTGGAIKKRHVDYFWGAGEKAEYAAWRTSLRGKFFLLLAK